jgi:hypothetical protein
VPGISSAVELSRNKEKGRLACAGGLRSVSGGVLPLPVVEDRRRLISGELDTPEGHTEGPRDAVLGGV